MGNKVGNKRFIFRNLFECYILWTISSQVETTLLLVFPFDFTTDKIGSWFKSLFDMKILFNTCLADDWLDLVVFAFLCQKQSGFRELIVS